jgi:Membrane domain of glycerophosphoryl diester phosphodiesterase
MAPPSLRPLSVGEILDVSFTLYRRHFAPIAKVALVCSGIPVLLSLFIDASGGMLANLPLALVYYLLFAALSSVATGATVFIVSESYLGGELDAGPALARATPLIGRLIVCSILIAIIVFVGFLMFFIPGIILLCGLMLAFPALVLEPGLSPTASLSRSWQLTSGSRWRMLGLLVTLLILLYVPMVAIGGVLSLFASSGPLTHARSPFRIGLIPLAAMGVVQIFVYPLFYCVLTVAYYDLRVRKEGFDLEVLAAALRPA